VNWVLDADIQCFYDAMAHSWIIRFLEHRHRGQTHFAPHREVAESRHPGRWSCDAVQLAALHRGPVISPILANVYLHYAYDLWVPRWRRTKATGDLVVVRYADDTNCRLPA